MSGKVITDWIMSKPTKENPSVLMIDELPKAYQTVMGFLHELTDERGSLYLSHSNQRLYRTPYHHVVITYNPMDKGNYVGFNLDPAFRDRFATIRSEYLSRPKEERVLLQVYGIKIPIIPTARADTKRELENPAQFISNLTQFAQLVRSAYKEGKLSTTVSTRGLITAVKLVKDSTWGQNEAVNALIQKFTENEIPLVSKMWSDSNIENSVRRRTTEA